MKKAKSGGGIIRWLAALSLVVICCGSGVVIGIPMLAGLAAVGSNTSSQASAEQAQIAATARVPSPPFEEILANYREMTDAQWNAYAETLVGKRATDWTGRITEVDEGELMGDFTVFVQGTGTEFLENIYIDVPEDVAMQLRKDQRITFSGDITLASNAMGLTIRLSNAEIESVDVSR
jgi:hypothetical protein